MTVLLVLLQMSVGIAATSTATTGMSASSNIEEVLLAISVNGQKPADASVVLRETGRGASISREDLLRWRLIVPATGGLQRDGDTFYRLDDFPDLTYRIDESQQALLIDASARAFSATRVAGSRGVLNVPMPSPLGGFLNYDLFLVDDTQRTGLNALAEIGVFNALGVGVSSFVRQDLPEGARLLRLTTTWTHDIPSQMQSLRLGDVTNAAGSWGRSVRLGGVQWTTNFASQPGFVTFARPATSGEAALPSTIDLYIDDALRMRRQVPAGPFSIQDMPVLTGQGEARLVVTDMLGREQVIVVPYYANPSLLRSGLNAYSFEIGAIREDFGLLSNRYGRPLAVGTFRRGITDRFTGEVHAELLQDQQTAGITGLLLWPTAGVLSASLAASQSQPTTASAVPGTIGHTSGGDGGLIKLGFFGQRMRFGYGANVQFASADFAQVGLEPGQPAPRSIGQAYASFGARKAGSFAITYTYQDRRDAARLELLNASYGVTLGQLGFLSLSALRVFGAEASSAFNLNFTRLLGKRDTGSIAASHNADRTQASMRLQRSLPPGDGFGYRLSYGMLDSDRRDAAATLQNRTGTYGLEMGQSQGVTSYRASASGGVAFMDADAFLSRRIDNSFAVVKVPGYARVNIYGDNQPIARTNKNGTALISRLRPYEVNSVRIEQADLPMDAHIGTLQLEAIPYLRSGLLLSFPVKRSRGATFVIITHDGEPVPAGAVAKLAGQDEEFPVGLRGEIYVTGLAADNRVQVTWSGRSCVIDVPFPESTDPLPDLGTFKCSQAP